VDKRWGGLRNIMMLPTNAQVKPKSDSTFKARIFAQKLLKLVTLTLSFILYQKVTQNGLF